MNDSKKYKKIVLTSFVFIFYLYASFSVNAGEVFELEGEPGENDVKIISALNKLTNDKIISDKKTKGFSSRYVSKWYSALVIDVYVLGLAKREKMSLIRVEAPKKGAEKVFRNFLLEELTKKEITGGLTVAQPTDSSEPRSEFSDKSYLWGQTFALIQPAASVYYNSYKSPVYTGSDRARGMFGYIVADLLLAGIGYFYATTTMHSNSGVDKLFFKPARSGNVLDSPGADVFLGLLMLPRLYRAVGSWQDTATHNRILEISVSKSF